MDLEEPVKVSAQLCVGTVTRTALPAAINPYGCRFHVAQSFLRICAFVPPVRQNAPLNVLQCALDGARPNSTRARSHATRPYYPRRPRLRSRRPCSEG